MKKELLELFSDGNGEISSMRVMALLVTIVILTILIAQNVLSMVMGKGFVDLPVSCLAALGLAFGSKIAQNFTEK